MKRAPAPLLGAPRAARPAPTDPAAGVVSWNMNTTCNYRCTYCTQRFVDDRGRWARDVEPFLAAFGALRVATGIPWEVKLSGGEPFAHPRFLDVVRGLAECDVSVSVVTNFSRADLVQPFIAAAGPALRVLSCSLHLEYVRTAAEVDAFIARCVAAQAALQPPASLVVTCVATATALAQLAALRARFVAAGVAFKVQPEKQDRDVVAYTAEQQAQLLALGGHNDTGRIAPSFLGQPCWAGARYFIVDDRGDAYRCYPARRQRNERLGNLLDGSFALALGPALCRYAYCNCTVPIARGMMPLDAGVETAPLRSALHVLEEA